MDVSKELGLTGDLSLALSSPRREDIYDFEVTHDKKWRMEALRRFLALKDELLFSHSFDYVILDTSPGIHYWSINSLVAGDVLILMSKHEHGHRGHEEDGL